MYLMSYFRTVSEALHLALSQDGLDWTPLNNNEPVLRGQVGSRTLRDPHITRAEDGAYHLLSTNGWASRSIIHASSCDLLHWSAQEVVPVMATIEGTRNCWAPKCYYDAEERVYRLIWSSTVRTGGPDRLWDHRIWSTATPDFKHYTPPTLFFDPGYSVIDATVAHHDGQYLMAFKDERGENRLGTQYKAIRVCTSRSARGPFENVSDLISPAPVEGPTLLRREQGWLMLYDHFLEERYGACQSTNGINWEVLLEGARFPPGARHACVLRVDESTVRGLQALL